MVESRTSVLWLDPGLWLFCWISGFWLFGWIWNFGCFVRLWGFGWILGFWLYLGLWLFGWINGFGSLVGSRVLVGSSALAVSLDPGLWLYLRILVVWLDRGTEHASLPRLSVSLLCRGNSRHWELSTGGGAPTKIGISPPLPSPPPHANNPVLYPRLSMRAKLVISYANGGAGSFRGKVCLKSRAMFLPTGDISCSKYFDLAASHPSSL